MARFDFNTPITKDINLYAMYNCTEINPDNPTFENLQLALATGNPSAYYPIGSGIGDIYMMNGSTAREFTWIIVHYGTALVNDTGVITPGAYLMSSTCLEASGTNQVNSFPATSAYSNMQKNGTWYNRTSAAVKAAISNVSVPAATSQAAAGNISADFFPPSVMNIGGVSNYTAPTTPIWQYFSGSDAAGKRALPSFVNTTAGVATWTRDFYTVSSTLYYYYCVKSDGGIAWSAHNTTAGFPFCCFVADPTYTE